MKLNAHQSVADALTLLNREGQNYMPVYDQDIVIGKISYTELRAFINNPEKPGSISAAKLQIDLRTALSLIKSMQMEVLREAQKEVKQNRWLGMLSSAAVIAAVLFGFAWLFFEPINDPFSNPDEVAVHADSNQVTLVLANGTNIPLSNDQDGIVTNSAQLTYHDGTLVSPALNESGVYPKRKDKALVMTMSTPKDRMYRITLADGTKVWLNHSSQLIFPSAFGKNARRLVHLSGEAYFEVTKIKKSPFVVTTAKQEIEVLGTHFNVEAYPDQPSLKTTLLEGLVRITPFQSGQLSNADPAVTDPLRIMGIQNGNFKLQLSKAVILKPDQQAVLASAKLSIKPVHAAASIAWTKNDFSFRNMPLEQVMNVVAAWYKVKIVYPDKATRAVVLGGSIQRSDQLPDVLSALAVAANLHFEIKDKRVIVTR